MDESAIPVNRMAELPEETREFLAQLREDDIRTLKDGVKLVNAIQTVGKFFKWLLVGMLGMAVGTVMFGESVSKIVSWFRQ
ncbi:hypothetical protein ASD64_01230 [Mesorhizobium sp. Root157]|nr:hypothetical protein ASD64_01230 [Mesorhizobium sp. Root157]